MLYAFEGINQKKTPQMKKQVLFHQDNALCHKSITKMAKLHEFHFELLPQPPYSSDLVPSDCWLFVRLKRMLSGERFGPNWSVFWGQRPIVLQKGIELLEKRWNQSVCVVHSIGIQTFFVQAFKIVVDSWKFSMLLLYILWYDWPIFMISGSNQQLQQQLEYTLLKPDCHCWWISKMQSGHEDTLGERYAIKFCFKLEKNATETYGMLRIAFRPYCMNWASVF